MAQQLTSSRNQAGWVDQPQAQIPQGLLNAQVMPTTGGQPLAPQQQRSLRAVDPDIQPAPAPAGAATPVAEGHAASFANALNHLRQALSTVINALDMFKACRSMPLPEDPTSLVGTIDRSENCLNALMSNATGGVTFFPRLFMHLGMAAVYGLMGLAQWLREATAGWTDVTPQPGSVTRMVAVDTATSTTRCIPVSSITGTRRA